VLSKIFETGPAIYTAVVVARSTGRLYKEWVKVKHNYIIM